MEVFNLMFTYNNEQEITLRKRLLAAYYYKIPFDTVPFIKLDKYSHLVLEYEVSYYCSLFGYHCIPFQYMKMDYGFCAYRQHRFTAYGYDFEGLPKEIHREIKKQ